MNRLERYFRFFGPRGAADVDDELRFHVEMRIRDYMARGMSESEARAATAQRLGDLVTARDSCITITHRRERRMTRAQVIDALVQDVRFAFRTLGRQKGWTAIAVLTLALGIGANSAMFSVVNHLLLNPLPYPSARRIAIIFQEPSQGNTTGMRVMITPSAKVVAAWRANAKTVEALEPYTTTDVTVERSGEQARIAHAASILPTFASMAGQRPILGRLFVGDELKGKSNVLLLSEGTWRTAYGADERVLGRPLTVNNKVFTIIGVMSGEFQLPRMSESGVDLWLPLDMTSLDQGLLSVARLRPGIARAAAERELDAIARREEVGGKQQLRFVTKLVPPASMVSFHDSLILLSVAVALVLLIACANVAHLLLARGTARQREIAIRSAVGAGSGRLFRQLLTESLLLSLAGCVAGLAIGWVGLNVLVAARPDSLADLASARMDGTALVATVVISLVTGLAFGVIGAGQTSRHGTLDALKAGTAGGGGGRSHRRLRGLLVVTEMALCTMLLVGAALLLRSVSHLQSMDAGFDAHGLYAIDVHLPADRYKSDAVKTAFYAQLTARVRQLPGVKGVTIAATAPAASSFLIGALQLEGEPAPPAGTTQFINFNGVAPDFFRFMGIRLVDGTTFTDTSEAAGQIVVNQGMARKYWPGRSAIGRKIRVVSFGRGDWKTVVGVAADASTQGLTNESSQPLLYEPGFSFFSPAVILRTAGDATQLPILASLVSAIDPHLPPAQVTSVASAMEKSIARPRFTMYLLLVFTLIAVGLAAIGLYGVLAYTVAQRTREIGIRVALGASRRTVARSVVSQGLLLAAIGAVIGLGAARASSKLLGSMLYGVAQTDAVAFAGGGAMLVLIALIACIVPTRRALAVDPLIAMRAD